MYQWLSLRVFKTHNVLVRVLQLASTLLLTFCPDPNENLLPCNHQESTLIQTAFSVCVRRGRNKAPYTRKQRWMMSHGTMKQLWEAVSLSPTGIHGEIHMPDNTFKWRFPIRATSLTIWFLLCLLDLLAMKNVGPMKANILCRCWQKVIWGKDSKWQWGHMIIWFFSLGDRGLVIDSDRWESESTHPKGDIFKTLMYCKYLYWIVPLSWSLYSTRVKGECITV